MVRPMVVDKCFFCISLRGGVALVGVAWAILNFLVMCSDLFGTDINRWLRLIGRNGTSTEDGGKLQENSTVSLNFTMEGSKNCSAIDNKKGCKEDFDFLASVPGLVYLISGGMGGLLIAATDTWQSTSALCYETKENRYTLIPWLLWSPVPVLFLVFVAPIYMFVLAIPMLVYFDIVVISYFKLLQDRERENDTVWNSAPSGEQNA